MWITDILRKRIGYRDLIVSDDLEMGGVLSAAPIGEASVEFVRAGGDLCLVCHREDYVHEAHEALIKAAEVINIFEARSGVVAPRAGVQEEVWTADEDWQGPDRVGSRETDSSVVGVWRAGAAGTVEPAGRSAASRMSKNG